VLQLQIHYLDMNLATAFQPTLLTRLIALAPATRQRTARKLGALIVLAAVPTLLHMAPPSSVENGPETTRLHDVSHPQASEHRSVAPAAVTRTRLVEAKGQRLSAPVSVVRVTSKFGMRVHPIRSRWHEHTGIDLAAPRGTPVFAAAAGTVRFVGRDGNYGNYVVVEHANHLQTWYGHLSSFAKGLRKGRVVQQGETLGAVGSTGAATGPHLHFEVRKNGQPVDPAPLTDGIARRLRGARLLKG
jgi:murein DD-endopeptidase MepM/ murein hydrolase activator NlpD